jgi:hypothetical protein
MSFCCVRPFSPEARIQCRRTSRRKGKTRGGICWIAGMGLFVWAKAFAADRAQLDRCQTQLSACYETCKSEGVASNICDARCTTDQCGLPWREAYGAFLDRRIEETAAPVTTTFTGLRRIKGERRGD